MEYFYEKQAHLENIVYMIKEKTVENIEEGQTQEKFVPNYCFGESGRITEIWIEQFIHQQVHVFNKPYAIDCRWYIYLQPNTKK